MEWGKPGDGPGEFNLPHGIAIDAQGRVYVVDRSNSRIQVFDLNGKHLDQWPGLRLPLYIAVSKDQHVWVSSGRSNKMLKYDLNGHLLYSWGTFGAQPDHLWGVHSFDTDSEGTYTLARCSPAVRRSYDREKVRIRNSLSGRSPRLARCPWVNRP